MAERTVSIDSMSKTYSVTGWRVGWVIASPELSRRHPPGPRLPDRRRRRARSSRRRSPASTLADAYYDDARSRATASGATCSCPALEAAGFRVHRPAGAYYVMTDIRDLTDDDDVAFARRLIARPGRRGRARARRSSRVRSSAGRSSGSRSRSGSRRSARPPIAWPRWRPRRAVLSAPRALPANRPQPRSAVSAARPTRALTIATATLASVPSR